MNSLYSRLTSSNYVRILDNIMSGKISTFSANPAKRTVDNQGLIYPDYKWISVYSRIRASFLGYCILFSIYIFLLTGNGRAVDSFVNISAVHDYQLLRTNQRIPGETTHRYKCSENYQNVSRVQPTLFAN